MENNYYGETTQLADVRLKENMDSLYEKTRLGLGDFEEIKAISEDVARKIDRVQEGRSMKRINTQNIRLEKRIFWDYFREETYGKTKLEDLKNEMKKSFGLGLDIQTEFKELCSKLERLTSLSYKEDLRHIVEFYVDLDFEDMKLYNTCLKEFAFGQSCLFDKFVQRYTKQDLQRDLEEEAIKELIERDSAFRKKIQKLKESNDFEAEKEKIISQKSVLKKYIAAKWHGSITERAISNWMSEQCVMYRENLLQLSVILKLTREELNDALKKLGYRELYYLDNQLLELFLYHALEYNRKNSEHPLSYKDIQELAQYGVLLLEEQEKPDEDEILNDLISKSHFNRFFLEQLDEKIDQLEERIEEIKQKMGVESISKYRVQAVVTRMLIASSDELEEGSPLKKLKPFDGTKQWVEDFVAAFSDIYQYQYLSEKITLYELFEVKMENYLGKKYVNVFEIYKNIWSIQEEEKDINSLFFSFMRPRGLNREAAIQLILLTYLSDITREKMNQTLEKLHFGPLNPRVKKDAILLSFLDYIGMAEITDSYIEKFLKILSDKLEKEQITGIDFLYKNSSKK